MLNGNITMSDVAVQNPSPAKRGRGSRGGRGAGRGAASTRARGKPAIRRGRAKVYEHARVQAAHERARDLKNSYVTLAAAMKPALEELADRNLDRLRTDFNAHQEVEAYNKVTHFLDKRLEDRIASIETERQLNDDCAHQHMTSYSEVDQMGCQVRIRIVIPCS